MIEKIDIFTGEIVVGDKNKILSTSAVGSCIALAMYNKDYSIGGLAHIMLPDKAPDDYISEKNRYAENAIDNLVSKLKKQITNVSDEQIKIEACIAGGGNVLRREDDTICAKNIESVTNILKNRNISLKQKDVGGYSRRSMKLDIKSGDVYYSVGSGNEKKMFCFKENA